LESVLLGDGLETTVTELGRGIDELEGDLLESTTGGVLEEGLPEGDDTLDGSRAGTLDQDEVVLDDTVTNETTDGGDSLLGNVELSRSRSLVVSLSDTVDLLVDLGTVVVTVLTSTGNREHDLRRVPRSDTRDLSETLVGLTRKLLGSPTVGNTLESVTGGDTDDVDVLVLLEDRGDVDGLLEVRLGELDLVGDRTSVDLDLHEVSLLLLETGLADLGVGEDTDDGAVLGDALEFTGDRRLGSRFGVLLGVLGEGLLLRPVPVAVEATLDFVGKVLGPNGGEGSETAGSFDVTDDTNDDHRRSLDDGGGLDDFLLVHLGSGTVKVTDDVSHTGLVTKESGEVDRCLGVILGESLCLSAVSRRTLAGQETKGTATGVLVLPVRHSEPSR